MKHFYKKIIPQINIALPFYLNKVFLSLTKDNGAARQHKLQYKDGVAMQDNEAQHWWNSAILVENTISNTGKFVKIVYPNFFGEDGGRNIHHSEPGNWWLQVVVSDEDTDDQKGKPPTPPFPLSSAYYHYVHNLLIAPANILPPKHCFTNIVPKNI